jgi:hypothetical protein
MTAVLNAALFERFPRGPHLLCPQENIPFVRLAFVQRIRSETSGSL